MRRRRMRSIQIFFSTAVDSEYFRYTFRAAVDGAIEI
jgi:hypothetical protein